MPLILESDFEELLTESCIHFLPLYCYYSLLISVLPITVIGLCLEFSKERERRGKMTVAGLFVRWSLVKGEGRPPPSRVPPAGIIHWLPQL